VNRLFGWIDRAIELLVALLFIAILTAGTMQIFNRFVLNSSLSWSEELQKFGHIWIVFLAIPIAHQRGLHIHMDVVRRHFAAGAGAMFDLAVEVLWLAFGAALMVLSYQVSVVAARQTSPGLEIPMSWPYYGMVLGGVYLAFVAVRRIAGLLARDRSGRTP
jgi:TRAP-type C4-dicarboxylate transport system permease small subunit